MECSFHYMLMANQAMVHRLLLSALSDTELTMGQPKVLDYLKEHDGVSQKDIAKGCHIEAPSLTSILVKMEENGLVERKVLHGNRRSLYVFLTEKGKQNQKRVEEAFAVIEEAAFQGMKEEERKNFMISFMKIYDNLYGKKESFQWKN